MFVIIWIYTPITNKSSSNESIFNLGQIYKNIMASNSMWRHTYFISLDRMCKFYYPRGTNILCVDAQHLRSTTILEVEGILWELKWWNIQSNPNTPLSSSHGYALSIHVEQGKERKKNVFLMFGFMMKNIIKLN